jgi:methionyl-tRNA formyltransferase
MRLIYAGTPEFAVPALEALIGAGHDIALVLTQPDRPAGRGMKSAVSAVKQAAQRYGLRLYQPASLKSPEEYLHLSRIGADALVVAAYGLIFPQAALDIPRLGAFNIHASLLPRWRGAAPIQRAILAGDTHSGVCIMRMDAGLDTGPIILEEAVAIDPAETAGSLQKKLAALGARLIGPALNAFADGCAQLRPQPQSGISYAAKISKAESLIDWRQPAIEIERLIRAFDPAPGARSRIHDSDLKLWGAQASAAPAEDTEGCILSISEEGVAVSCGKGVLRLSELQRPGGKRLRARDFLQGFALKPGDRFDVPSG